MKRNWTIAAGVALIGASFFAPIAQADTITGVEGARAKLRAGGPLTPHDRALLNRWGTGTGRQVPSGRMNRRPSTGY